MESEQAKMYNMLAINIENNVILQDCEIAEFHPQAAVEKLFAEINLVAEINKSSTATNVMENDHQLEKLNVEEIKLEAKIAELQLLKGEKIESLQQNKAKLAKLNIEKKERQQFENEENKIKTKKYQNSWAMCS